MTTSRSFTDIHTHRKHADGRAFIRNAYIPRNLNTLTKLGYPVSCGIHPWYINGKFSNSLLQLEQCLKLPEVYAVGEFGLDYVNGPDRELQMMVFREQLMLAAAYQLPVILHMVRSLHDLIPLIRNHPYPVIIHDYAGSIQITSQLLKYPVYFSFGHYFFRNDARMRTSLKEIPMNRLFVETDVHSYEIAEVYSRIADTLNINTEQLCSQIRLNFTTVFTRHNEKH